MWVVVIFGLSFEGFNKAVAGTNTFDFTYTNRQELLADGWDFLARTATGQVRDTETTTGSSPPDVSYDQIAHPGTLQVALSAGDLWAGSNNTTNSLFRNLSSNWVSLQLSLTVLPTENYQQVHLALYQDDDNYVEIGHGFNASVGGDRIQLIMENGGVQLGSPRIVTQVAAVSANVHLRLERNLTNDFVVGRYSNDGTNWNFLGEVSHEFVNPRLCIWAGGSTSGNALLCSLRRVEVITSDTPLDPILVAEPRHLVFNAVAGEACTNLQQLRVVARRSQSPVSWTLTTNASWLSASLVAGNTPASADVAVDTAGLSPGVYRATLSGDGVGAISMVTDVTLVVNPAVRARAATWQGGSKGAMSVSVDDSEQSGFAKLDAQGLKGTYLLWGRTPYTPFVGYHAAGMELGAHTVDHPCTAVNEPTRRYELEVNLASIIAETGVPAAEVISFAWPCGFTTIRDQVIAADYFLSARGYNLNELEDPSPRNWMNLKSYNSHENNALDLNPSAPPNPPDLKPLVDAAEAQGKWFNLVLHTMNNDDNAIAYAMEKDVWVAPIGSVVKYIQQRDRTVFTNYTETATNLSFDCYRLALDSTRVRSFETAVLSNDQVTVELDIANLPSAGALTVAGVETAYRVRDVAAGRRLFFNTAISTNLITVSLVTSNGTPVAVDQRLTVAEDGATNFVLVGTSLPGHSLEYAVVTSPTNGILTGTVPDLTYTPATNFHGVDGFTFRVTDTDSSLTATGLVRLAVSSVNDAPVLLNPFPNQEGIYGTPFLAFATNVFWDVDGDFLTNTATGMPPGVAVTAVGTMAGTPAQAGNFAVQLVVRDGGAPSFFATNSFNFVIGKSNAPVSLENLSQVYNGAARNVAVSTLPPGLSVNVTYGGGSAAPTNAGSYEVIGTVVENNYTGSATNTLTVTEVPLVITGVTVTDTMDVGVTWQSVSNFSYLLQYKNALDDEAWVDLPPPITATGATVTTTNTVGDQPQRFYRVLLVP